MTKIVELTDAECEKLELYYDSEAKRIADLLGKAKKKDFAALANDMAALSRLAGKFESARPASQTSMAISASPSIEDAAKTIVPPARNGYVSTKGIPTIDAGMSAGPPRTAR